MKSNLLSYESPVRRIKRCSMFLVVSILVFALAGHAAFGQAGSLGNVNNDSSVDIVDALLIAQYYVGLNPPSFINTYADVNASGSIDIVDALLIAQYYVGLISQFPGQATPAPTAVVTTLPTAVPGAGFSYTGVLPNGLIDGAQVSYTATAGFDGTNVTITFNAGAGFEWVWLYTPDYRNMSSGSSNTWVSTFGGFSQGQTIRFSFTVRKNGQEANSSGAEHSWVIGTTSDNTPVPTAYQTPGPTSDPLNYTLVWSDEFTNGISSDWVFETGNGSSGWGNNELEYYRQENAAVSNGELVITAKKESYAGFNYTSARMKTEGRKSWTYGKIEARLKVSVGQGLWPAFWMLGRNISSVSWPACGEIDIFEHINREAAMNGTIHWDSGGHASYGGTYAVNVADYHVYAIEWNASSIKWFVDGAQYLEANILNNVNNTEEFHRDFFILLNLAVGGNWPGAPDSGTQFPAYMYVDYVRVYQ